MSYYVTKYALSVGVLVVSGEVSTISPEMLCYRVKGGRYDQYAHGKDWHATLEAALADAERRRVRKIESLKKSIQKLERLDFASGVSA